MGFESGQSRVSGGAPAGGGGGGGTATGVALVPVAPDVSTDVQGGYEYTRRSQGDLRKIDDLEMLDFWAPPGDGIGRPLGERVIDFSGATFGNLLLRDDEYLQFAAGGGLEAIPPSGRGQIIGNVAGGLVRGPVWMSRVTLVNLHASGLDAALSAPGGEIISLLDTLLAGGNGATISGALGLIVLRGFGLFGGGGIVFSGVIGALNVITSGISPLAVVDLIAFTFDSSVVFGVPARFDGNSFSLTDASQSVFAIDGGVTSGPVAIEITNSSLGPADFGTYFDTDGANIDESDSRLIVNASRPVTETLSAPDFIFSNTANPVVLTGEAADTWHVVPHIAGVGLGPGLVAALASQRWRAVDTLDNSDLLDSTPIDRWALRAEQPTTVRQPMDYSITASASGNPEVRTRLEINTDPGTGGSFVAVPDSERPTVLSSQDSPATSAEVVIVGLAPGSRIRLAVFRAGSTLTMSIPLYTIIGESPL